MTNFLKVESQKQGEKRDRIRTKKPLQKAAALKKSEKGQIAGFQIRIRHVLQH